METPQAESKKPFVPKKANLTTVLCFVRSKRIAYTPKDMHQIGKKLADLYRQQYNREPQTIQQVEGRHVIVVNAFPYEFSKYIHKTVSEHFSRKNGHERGKKEYQPRR